MILLIKGKKVSGILLESSGEDERLKYVIAGIGIVVNLKVEDYPEELRSIATSLAIESGGGYQKRDISTSFSFGIRRTVCSVFGKGFRPDPLALGSLECHSQASDPHVIHQHGVIEGIADSLDDSGALTVITGDGERIKVYSGDIELR